MKGLRTGINAYYDTVFSGLIHVKVLSVTAPDQPPVFDIGFGQAKQSINVKCRVTCR
jgi:hypothetical protein